MVVQAKYTFKQSALRLLGEKRKCSHSSILVLIPALNEEKGISHTIREFKYVLSDPQFLVVDGKSKDDTVNVAKDLGVDVIYQAGRGKGDAIASALRYLNLNSDIDYVVLTDADYTYPAEFVPQMLTLLEENPQVGMVCGNRFNSHFDLKGMADTFYVGNRILAFTHNMLNGVALHDPLTGLRVIRWEILKNWKPKSEGFDIEVELNHYVERQGYGIVEIPINYRPRIGEKKLKFRHGLSILTRILIESM